MDPLDAAVLQTAHANGGRIDGGKKLLIAAELKISRDELYVKKVGVDGKVTWVVDREHIARCGLRISALKWTAARMAPRKYGKPLS